MQYIDTELFVSANWLKIYLNWSVGFPTTLLEHIPTTHRNFKLSLDRDNRLLVNFTENKGQKIHIRNTRYFEYTWTRVSHKYVGNVNMPHEEQRAKRFDAVLDTGNLILHTNKSFSMISAGTSNYQESCDSDVLALVENINRLVFERRDIILEIKNGRLACHKTVPFKL